MPVMYPTRKKENGGYGGDVCHTAGDIFYRSYPDRHRLNLFTLVAVLGMLPAARSAVGWIMILLQKPAIRISIEKRGPDLVRGYELMVTAYEGRLPLDAMVICGNQVACYSSAQKGDLPMMEKHMEKILTTNGYHGVRVKIFRDLRPYLERVEQLEKDPEKYRRGFPLLRTKDIRI